MKKNLFFTKFYYDLMKFSVSQFIIIGLFYTFSYAHDARAQAVLNKQLSLSFESIEIKKVINEIEKLADVKFVYSGSIFASKQNISLKTFNQKLGDVLAQILTPLDVSYEVIGNRILLKKSDPSIVTSPNEAPKPLSISTLQSIEGLVKSTDGETLAGVSVVVKATTRGTTTDGNGKYTISADAGEVLVFSFVGFINQEVKVLAENASINITLKDAQNLLGEVAVVGTRFENARSNIDRPVAIDVISAKELQTSGQVDLGQAIHFIAPSFNAVKFGINDAAPFVDPASLRGLGPDQVLVLVNNKRRHKVSFLSINDGVGKGQVGTDVNVVPALSLKRVEVLRDGAAAQYGSDAIGGVINMELNDASSGGAINTFFGIASTKPNLDVKGVIAPEKINDGLTYNLAANAGLKLGKKGFVNTTLSYAHTDGYDRSGTYKASAGFYVKDPVADAALVAKNNIDLDRAVLGSAENTTIGLFVNAGIAINNKLNFYTFGGYTNKHVVTGVFTRPPSNVKRSVLSIFPNGYNPIAPADLNDYSITSGIKGKVGNGWNLDLSAGQGSNKVDFYAENTVNPSLGDASPTEFYVGKTQVTQSLLNADIAKTFNKGKYPNYSIGVGTEFRYETFQLGAGDPASYQAGSLKTTRDVGSSGREGFSDKTAGKWNRTNVGVYVEGETDLKEWLLFGAAARFENYSDFGSNVSWKINSRVKIVDPLSIRGSVSKGFRAPSMTQAYYSNYVNISFDNAGNSIINPIISATSALAKTLGVDGLKQETSLDYSGGVTSKIGKHFTLTADVYQIDVDNRIMLSGGIDVSKFEDFRAAGFPQTANVFVNAIDTRTKGFEFVANYNTAIGTKSKIVANVAFSSMNTTLRETRTTSKGIVVADKTATLYITDGLPKNKLIVAVNYTYGMVDIMVRASRFGQVSDPLATLAVKPTDPNAVTYQVFPAKTLGDIAVTIRPIKKMSIIAGVNNVFDVYPDLLQIPQTTNEVLFSRRTNQFGTQGRFLNLSVNYNF
jgi:iron complex outermembrane receptor protein